MSTFVQCFHCRMLDPWQIGLHPSTVIQVCFNDVFLNLQTKIENNPSHGDCSLICDGMSIKSNIFYNNATGNYDGFINFGEGIAVPDEETVAKEALVLMLVCFKGQWKYPVGYILIDKIDAETLNC